MTSKLNAESGWPVKLLCASNPTRHTHMPCNMVSRQPSNVRSASQAVVPRRSWSSTQIRPSSRQPKRLNSWSCSLGTFPYLPPTSWGYRRRGPPSLPGTKQCCSGQKQPKLSSTRTELFCFILGRQTTLLKEGGGVEGKGAAEVWFPCPPFPCAIPTPKPNCPASHCGLTSYNCKHVLSSADCWYGMLRYAGDHHAVSHCLPYGRRNAFVDK